MPITPQNPSLLLSSLPDAAFYRAKGLRDLKKALKAPRFEGKAKNIIVFVGDGMGVSTHTMSRIYKGQKKGRSGEEESLVWEDWDYSGLIKVSLLSANQFTQICGAPRWFFGKPFRKEFFQNICKLSAPNVTNCEAQGQGVISFNNLEELNYPYFCRQPVFQVLASIFRMTFSQLCSLFSTGHCLVQISLESVCHLVGD